MSIHITLYPTTATKTSLLSFLVVANFHKSRHLLDSMNAPDKLHYIWFGYENYESTTGVEAQLYKVSPEERKKYNCSEWVLQTRTRSSGSYEDKQKQNEIIRKARREFGGSFFNDSYGTNKYTPLEGYKKFSPLEKGISIVASNSIDKLMQIEYCLSNYTTEMSESINSLSPELKRFLFTKDPAIILYNSLMPFLVSVLEYFFGQSFANFLKYDIAAKDMLLEEKIKIGIADVVNILQKETSVEQIVTQSYNFQNIESINKAYAKYLSIDIKATLYKKKKINGKLFQVLPKVREILEARHRFVHELDINYDLTKQGYLDYIRTVENAIMLVLQAFKAKHLKIEIVF